MHTDSQILKHVDKFIYLGFTFSSDKNDNKDILRQLGMSHTKSNRLLRLFHHCSTDENFAYFCSYCTCYCCPFLWTYYKNCNQSKFRMAFKFNYLYRRIVKLPPRSSVITVYAVNNIDSLEVLIRKRCSDTRTL